MYFPGKLYCFKSRRKLIQHAVSTFQHYWKWRGARMTCRTEQSWESMRRRFTIYSIFFHIKRLIFYIKKSIPFLDIRTSFFDLKKSISWYQTIDSWYKKNINLSFWYKISARIFNQGLQVLIYKIFFDIKKLDSFFISKIPFFDINDSIFYIKTSIVLYQEIIFN